MKRRFFSLLALALLPVICFAQATDYVCTVHPVFSENTVSFLNEQIKDSKRVGEKELSKYLEDYAYGNVTCPGYVYTGSDGKNYVVTNYHVIQGAKIVSVDFALQDGSVRTYYGLKIAGVEKDLDIALLEFPKSEISFESGLSSFTKENGSIESFYNETVSEEIVKEFIENTILGKKYTKEYSVEVFEQSKKLSELLSKNDIKYKEISSLFSNELVDLYGPEVFNRVILSCSEEQFNEIMDAYLHVSPIAGMYNALAVEIWNLFHLGYDLSDDEVVHSFSEPVKSRDNNGYEVTYILSFTKGSEKVKWIRENGEWLIYSFKVGNSKATGNEIAKQEKKDFYEAFPYRIAVSLDVKCDTNERYTMAMPAFALNFDFPWINKNFASVLTFGYFRYTDIKYLPFIKDDPANIIYSEGKNLAILCVEGGIQYQSPTKINTVLTLLPYCNAKMGFAFGFDEKDSTNPYTHKETYDPFYYAINLGSGCRLIKSFGYKKSWFLNAEYDMTIIPDVRFSNVLFIHGFTLGAGIGF